ncbi:dTDP-glucose 4,6-dehydratase [uncultured Nevskia sp.]|uniref:dTDP-glucose 4,6-dehydratase n=1 Tax=uncultured Nevskia sp. TaxID=228950 RepID=UPI0025F9382F|nr:dTDP-glucose 4,6-dehydratase [uncultured Nevskia sp.]
MTTVLITGCAGFIGSTVLRQWLADTDWRLVGVDKFAYAGLRESIAPLLAHPRFSLQVADICDGPALHALLAREQPDGIVHLAAESHVDRSLNGPAAFIQTNLVGTAMLLEVARAHLETLPAARREAFRFLQVSTDEVFGALGPTGRFDEASPHAPNSPYSATKAGADHLVRAWHRSYGLPVLTTHSPNNYGPRQIPEKLIPRMIHLALQGKPLPIYGKGDNVRDWLHVDDHARALRAVLERGRPGETYCIGGGIELSNLDLVQQLCTLLDARRPADIAHARLIEHVTDRPGHDWRYAINGSKLERELGWRALQPFTQGLADTVDWYLDNPDWMARAWEQIQQSAPPVA